jgi:hypothetical protein
LVFGRGVFVDTVTLEETIIQIHNNVLAVSVNIRHDMLGMLAQGSPFRSMSFQSFEREHVLAPSGHQPHLPTVVVQ